MKLLPKRTQQQSRRLRYRLIDAVQVSGLEYPIVPTRPMQENLGPAVS